jgi:hypothetical protein
VVTAVVTNCCYRGNHASWLLWLDGPIIALLIIHTQVAITSEEEKKNCCVRRTHNCFVNSMKLSTTREASVIRQLYSFPAFYGTRRLSTEFTRALHLSLYYPPTYVLVFPAASFPLDFPPTTYMLSTSPHSCCMSCSSHPPLRDYSNYTWLIILVPSKGP